MKNSETNEKEIRDWKWASSWSKYTKDKNGKLMLKNEEMPSEVKLYRKLRPQVDDILYRYKKLYCRQYTKEELDNDIKKCAEIMKPLDLEKDFTNRYIKRFLM